jgi:hypothetical protein
VTDDKIYDDKCDFCGAKHVICLHMKLRANVMNNNKITIEIPDEAFSPKIIRKEKSICEWCLQDISIEMFNGMRQIK